MPDNAESFSALCSDWYINQRLSLKMDLPANRETVFGLFERVRREFPAMDRFRRFNSELALESDQRDGLQQWLAIRRTSVRSGAVNPSSPTVAYRYHRLLLDVVPYFLSISPLDIDYLEVLYGFDLLAAGNHDAIVFDALLAGSPLAQAVEMRGGTPVDCRPLVGLALDETCDLQAVFEIKTRTPARAVRTGEYTPEPLSIYLIVRKYGAIADVRELGSVFQLLTEQAEQLLHSRVIPNVLLPIREAIGSSNL